MTKREHQEIIVGMLREILNQPNARVAARHKLYTERMKLMFMKKGK